MLSLGREREKGGGGFFWGENKKRKEKKRKRKKREIKLRMCILGKDLWEYWVRRIEKERKKGRKKGRTGGGGEINTLDGADAQFQEAHRRTFQSIGIYGDAEVGEGEGRDGCWEE